MSDPRNSVANTLRVAIGVSVVCSVLVAAAAVLLRPVQERNETAYRQRIILEVAGRYEPGGSTDLAAAGIEVRLVDLASGRYVEADDAAAFDPVEAASDPAQAVAVPEALDIANVRRRAALGPVYLVYDADRVEQIILPVRGAGLWSTMYGYLALDRTGQRIRGLRFYEHGETPGLGDQIDRPQWRAAWEGKRLYSQQGTPAVSVIKGAAESEFEVDGLAGATLTGRGVTLLIHYWAGEHAYGPYLAALGDTPAGAPEDEP